MSMYGATTLADCLTVVKTVKSSTAVYNLSHPPSGEWGTLYWEDEAASRPHWLLVTSEDGGYWTQQFFMEPEELPDVVAILFREGWTWLK